MVETRSTLGGLSCTVVQDGGSLTPDLAVVLCHGFGAPGDDLVALAPELFHRSPAIAGRTRFVFPAAPIALPPANYGEGRAWWPLDIERVVMMQRRGPEALLSLRQEAPEGLPLARRMMMALISELCAQTKLPISKIVLGGFSQGAMLATDVSLRLEEPAAALGILSGTLIAEAEWKRRAGKRSGLTVFQSHGRQDPILPFANATALHELLTESGLSVDFLPFDGGHTIPSEALAKLAKLIATCLP